MKIKAIDLFCGVGGLTKGLSDAGINVVAGIDIDKSCAHAYSINNHSKFINRSISEITKEDIELLYGDVDIRVMVGCAPCQPFSSHQKEKKDRSKHKDWNLLYQFGRLIQEVKPDIVSMENVPQLIKEKVFEDFLIILKKENYKINFKIVNAADYGVPQRRKRLILLASQKVEIKLIDPDEKNYRSVRTAIGMLPAIRAGEKNLQDCLHVASRLSKVNLERIACSIPGGTWRDWPQELRLKCHSGEKGQTYSSVYGRMKWDEPSPTITTQFISYGTGRFGHPEQNRALTLREGALLQSFPPQYQFLEEGSSLSFKTIARHIGNAVPPKLGEAIGKSILLSINRGDSYE